MVCHQTRCAAPFVYAVTIRFRSDASEGVECCVSGSLITPYNPPPTPSFLWRQKMAELCQNRKRRKMGLVRLNRPIGGVPVSEDAGCPAPPPCEALTQRWVEKKQKKTCLAARAGIADLILKLTEKSEIDLNLADVSLSLTCLKKKSRNFFPLFYSLFSLIRSPIK